MWSKFTPVIPSSSSRRWTSLAWDWCCQQPAAVREGRERTVLSSLFASASPLAASRLGLSVLNMPRKTSEPDGLACASLSAD